MNGKEIFLSTLILVILPFFVGMSLCTIAKRKGGVVKNFVYGTITIYAFMQFITVPLVFFKKSFALVYNLTILFIVLFITIGLLLKILQKDFHFPEIRLVDIFYVALLIALSIYFLYQVFIHQHFDEDDSRFVVNALDILNTDRLFLTNPATGNEIEWFTLGDSYKDTIAPWAVYIAFLSKFTGVAVVTMAHTIMPLGLNLLGIGSFWLFIGKLVEENPKYQSMFTILLLLVTMYLGAGNEYLALTHFLIRIWQGKATVAYVAIPIMYACLFEYYNNPDVASIMICLIANLAMCFLSSNGVVIGAIMIGSFSLIYGLIKKDYKATLKLMPLALINALYFVISYIMKGFME